MRSIASAILADPLTVRADRLHIFLHEVLQMVSSDLRLSIYLFPTPFADMFSLRDGNLNLHHTSVQWVIQALAAVILNKTMDEVPPDENQSWGQLVSELARSSPPNSQGITLVYTWKRFAEAIERAGIMPSHPAPASPTDRESYLPSYIPGASAPGDDWEDDETYAYEHPEHPWGYPLPPEWKPGDIIPPPPSHAIYGNL
jgi:hypothetical protein